MTIFRNFKNQSQRFMYYDYIWCFLGPIIALKVDYIKVKALGHFQIRSRARTSKTINNKMGKRKLEITLKVLNEVKVAFPQTKEYLEERLRQECLKENISVEQVIFFKSLKAKG